MKPYSELTPLGQSNRLRVLAANALTHYRLDVIGIRLITNDLNGIFRIDTRDGSKYILRITLPEGGHTIDHVRAEMDWLAALARDTRLSVPRPLRAIDGTLVVEAETAGVPEPRLCAIFSWVPGIDLAERMTEANLFLLGELMAKLHEHALVYHPPSSFNLLRFDRVFPFPEPVILFDSAFSAFFPPARRKVYETAIAWAHESIDRLITSAEPMRVLHGDLHQWNVRVARKVLSPIDFEDLMMGWPVQDIATTLYYLDQETALRSAFREGYEHHSPWPEKSSGEIDSFIAARGLGLVNFLLNDPNPAWKIKLADFIEKMEQRLRGLLQKNSWN